MTVLRLPPLPALSTRAPRLAVTGLAVMSLAALLATAAPAIAQQDSSNSQLMAPDSPDQVQVDTRQTPDFAAFWQHFLTAAKKNNRKALQAMTHLPFDLNTSSYDAAHFKELAAQIYDEKARACIAKETPVHDQDNYEVFCGETVYVFGTDPLLDPAAAKAADGSGWRLLEIGAND